MSATLSFSTSPGSSYLAAGFDQHDPDARPGWTIIWRGSESGRCITDRKGMVWMWDPRARVWMPASQSHEERALADHNVAMGRLRRALLAVRSLECSTDAEREAAYFALQRLATALVEEWYKHEKYADVGQVTSWFDHPGAIYLAVTRDCCNFLPDNLRLPFNAATFSDLVARTYRDYAAKRRATPPRLRPEDMQLLQTRVGQPVEPTEGKVPEVDHHVVISDVREQLAASIDEEDAYEAERRLTRRKRVLIRVGSGVFAILVAAIGGVIAFS